jgi:4-alpha-glucanotransferase
MNDSLERLAGQYGVGASYYDYRGGLHRVSRESKTALLAAMGLDVSAERDIDAAAEAFDAVRWMRMLPQACVISADVGRGPPVLPISIPVDLDAVEIDWEIEIEGGGSIDGTARIETLQVAERGEARGRAFIRVHLPLPADLPLGYHRIATWLDAGLAGETRLIVAPPRCYEPPSVAAGVRSWGIAVQLYSLRSDGNWGMGDLHDLRELIAQAAPMGCSIVGLNPLHALLPAVPDQISPYSPSNRQFLNVLYVAVPDVPEFAECAPAQERVADPEFQALLRQLRATSNVDYPRVAAAKFAVLRMIFEHFRNAHLATGTERAAAFHKFVRERGEPLRLHAIFDALDADLRLLGPQYWGWPSWPEEYRDPLSPAVNRFARDRAGEVEYFLYLQWLAEEQLYAAQQLARQSGMAIGLYGDVAVGANPGGSETWANRHLYVQQASVGAPPDPLALKGQDWGIPPQSPAELRAQEYEPFVTLIRNNMRATAALRLDHVMTLFRLWWVPRGSSSARGAYVHYPLDDLVAILALESVRNHCIVIGEDLGTVPDEVRDAMERYHVYHYKVLLFEKEEDQRFKAPWRYARNALATVTTHDLPTLRGWWEGLDIGLREQLDLYPAASQAEEDGRGRERERVAMMQALSEQRLWHWESHEPPPDYSPALARAIQCYLGVSNAGLAMIQIEDLIGMPDPANVPGTHQEHANWQRKVAINTADILAREEVREMLAAMNAARQGRNPNL